MGVAALVVVLTAVVGCAKPTIDGNKLEAKINADAATAGLKTTRVECPKERPAKKDDVFDCTVTLDNASSIVYHVTQTTDAGDYAYKLAENQVVVGADVAAQVKKDIAEGSNTVVDVSCPKMVLAPAGKAQFDCQAKLGDDHVTLAITVAPGAKLGWEIKK